MATPSRRRAAASPPAETPLAKRAVPIPKLIIPICLRCSKRVGSGGEDCVTQLGKTNCDYCAHQRKPCDKVVKSRRHCVDSLAFPQLVLLIIVS
jgi:hypothetical protein